MKSVIVLPSLKVSGGAHQALRLGDDLARRDGSVAVATLWATPHPLSTKLECVSLSGWKSVSWRALVQLPVLMLRFAAWVRALRKCEGTHLRFIFTHYATLPLALFVPKKTRFVFVQDLEWKFLRHPILSGIVRSAILFFYRRCAVVTANSYLGKELRALRVPVVTEIPIWADRSFLVEEEVLGPRELDFVMVLRKGDHKRLDLYLAFIAAAKTHSEFRIAVITPEDDILDSVRSQVALCLSRPSPIAMRDLYSRCKCFIHLSEHEGFGLPPLEAMGAGCVPLCRDSGGVRAFISGQVHGSLLLPLSMSIEQIATIAVNLVLDPVRLESLSRQCQALFREGMDVDRRRMMGIETIINTGE